MIYPPADRDDTVDVLHGVEVADPYRYLEDPRSLRTTAFVNEQNALSRPYLDALAGRPGFLGFTTAVLTAPWHGVPWERGGRYFMIGNPGDTDQDQLSVGDTPGDIDRVLIDPNLWSSDGTAALTGLRINDDGSLAAYARSDAGSDWRTIGIVDVVTGDHLADRLTGAKWLEPVWLPDGASFLYWRYPDAEIAASGAFTDATGVGELALHRIGTEQCADEVIWSKPDAKEWMVDPRVSDDGRLLVLSASPGTDSRNTVTVRRLAARGGRTIVVPGAVEIVPELADAHRVIGADGDMLYLRTERDAPHGALVAVDLADAGGGWQTLVEGTEQRILSGVAMARDSFLLLWSIDTAQQLQLTDRSGALRSTPELGSLVSFAAVHARPSSEEIFVGTTGFDHRLRVYRLTIDGSSAELPAPLGVPGLPPIRAARRTGRSADGTPVRMSVVRRADLPSGPAPTLLYGYGGFDIPLLPSFSALFAGWIAAGGVLAVANLRGGGEFGTAWHEAGMGHHKQRVFDDLIGCALALIDDGTTTAGQLAVHGRSNGGLLVGAVMTQRPELFAAALPTVGVMDLLRFHLFTIGWAWTSEYGTPEDPDDFAAIRAYSPLHTLRESTVYPPTLISTGDHDDRVVPAHSLKFGAQLQYCQAGPGPVLLRVDTRAGHGAGKPARALAQEYADQLAFAARWTGLSAQEVTPGRN